MRVIHERREPAGPDSSDRPDLGVPDPGPVFGQRFDAPARSMHRYLARRISDESAHDLVGETFLVALRRRDSYRPELGTAPASISSLSNSAATTS